MDDEIIYSWCFNYVEYFDSIASAAIIVFVENLESLTILRSQQELPYRTFPSSITMSLFSFISTRLMNDLGYGQLSNPNWSLKLVLMRVKNHRELLIQYF